MSDDDPTVPSRPTGSPRGGTRRALVLLALLSVGFLGWLSLRIRDAVGSRESLALSQAEAKSRAEEVAMRPPAVEVMPGTPELWEPVVTFEGTLSAQQEADLGFKTPGRLAQIRAKVGDRVRAGQTLATLSADEAAAQLSAAQAQLSAAQAQAGLATDAARRTALVVSSGAQSEAAGVQAEKQRELADAQLEAASAQVELARTALANHKLTAPFSGTVTRAPTAPGAVVAPGVPLFHVADLSRLKLLGTVGPEDAVLVRAGTALEILGADGRRVIGRGKITAVVPALDAATKRVPIEATVANDGAEPLLAGALVRAAVRGGAPLPVLAFPHTVLRPGSQNEVLVVVDDKLSIRRVEHVVAPDGRLLVRRGLAPTDQVVVRAWPEAADGQLVVVSGSAAAAETAPSSTGAP
jgi:RND family efflux transporter MFP subunit